MDGVLTLGFSEQLPDGARCSFSWIGCADDCAELGHGVVALERHWHTRTAGHELDQVFVEWSAAVHLVERSGFRLGQPNQSSGARNEPGLLKMRQDGSDFSAGDRVGFDNAERQGCCHDSSFMTC